MQKLKKKKRLLVRLFYTDSHGVSKNEVINTAASTLLEDWVDIREADEAYQKWVDSGMKEYTHDEMWQKLGVD
ncbi:DUF6290 family protein [Weissella cibaria]|uniref:Antitoxin n=1 Tax=Weissella cibaria TaxID=137591 RepID=A0A9Q8N885_9LACO|nr:DUF6290 family protein [Weissella cibaria]QDG81563.1 hypothetical protein Wei3612_09500 [Weissella cibaria]QMU88280.1 hypothetical protein H3N00_10050 [Weissella cibaria]TVV26862.1 hypothetical protein FO435_02640 [Weissella cibaria]TVV35574.1 hypothetical protein FO439_02640 [Weissella cibaria]TVV40062.1 hypothetical protein FO438_02490 [Weissella cibaria]